MGCASRKTLANFWSGVRVGLAAAAEAAFDVDADVAAADDAIVGNAVVVVAVELRARDLQDWLVQVVYFVLGWGGGVVDLVVDVVVDLVVDAVVVVASVVVTTSASASHAHGH